MTFIQPKRQFGLQDGALVFLVILMVGATFALVAVYNGIVNANHNLASLKAKLDQTGATNTNLQNQIIAKLGSGVMTGVAQSANLIEDKHPQYLSAGSSQSLTFANGR